MTNVLPTYPTVKPTPKRPVRSVVIVAATVAALGLAGFTAAASDDTTHNADRIDACFTQYGDLTKPFDGEFAGGTADSPETAVDLTRCLSQDATITQVDENIWAWHTADGERDGVAVSVMPDGMFIVTYGALGN